MNAFPDGLSPFTVLAAVSTFGFVFALWGLGLLLWLQRRGAQRDRILERLDPEQVDTPERTLRLWHEGKETTIAVPGRGRGPTFLERLEQMHEEAGWEQPMHRIVLLLSLAVAAAFVFAFALTASAVPAAGVAGTVLVVFWLYANRRASKRAAVFEQQLVDGLELSARALRAGHPLLGSFELIHTEIPAPVGRLFGDICQQHAMGVSLEVALRRAAELSKSGDMKLFAASLAIHMHSGGNLADVVEGLAAVIRERMRLTRRFRVITAQTQMSKRILLAMPVVMFGVLQLINPNYMRTLFVTPTGNVLLGVAVAGLLLGWMVMNKMAEVRV